MTLNPINNSSRQALLTEAGGRSHFQNRNSGTAKEELKEEAKENGERNRRKRNRKGR